MELKLIAQLREKNEKINPDFIAAVLYGKGLESRSLKVAKNDFIKVFTAAGESNLIDLEVEGKTVKVLVKETQKGILKNVFTHIDFYQVNMKEKITTEIPLHFIGESKAIRELGGMLMKEVHELEIECLPGDLVDHLDIDISILNSFDDLIKIKDLHLPSTWKLLGRNNDDVVAMVVEPKVEAEETKVEAAAPANQATPETEKKE